MLINKQENNWKFNEAFQPLQTELSNPQKVSKMIENYQRLITTVIGELLSYLWFENEKKTPWLFIIFCISKSSKLKWKIEKKTLNI